MDEVDIVYYYLKNFEFENPVMLDVGAHAGGSFYKFARDGWKVFAFEPNPQMRSRIFDNLKVWGFENVDVFNEAVSDVDGQKLKFYTSEESTGISSLIPFHDTHEEKFEVETITLKTFSQKNIIRQAHFVKIDVEGNDFRVLKGIDWTNSRPAAIVVEYEDKKTQSIGVKLQDLVDFLREKGYKILVSEWEPVVKYGVKHNWKCFLTDEIETKYARDGWGNIIAIRDYDQDLFMSAIIKSGIEVENKLENKLKKINSKNAQLEQEIKNKTFKKLLKSKIRSFLRL